MPSHLFLFTHERKFFRMSKLDIIRAWRDEEYRNSLSQEAQASLPENPAGQVELTASEMEQADGGSTTWICLSFAVSVQLCYSMWEGGSCAVTTFGCC